MGKVVVVNGFHRTGSTKCYYAAQCILAELGIPFQALGAQLHEVDAAIDKQLARAGPEWLTIKTHRWMPIKKDDRIVVFYTTRNLADVARSLGDHKLRRGELTGYRSASEGLDQFVTQEILWQAFFNAYCANTHPIIQIPYEEFYHSDESFIVTLAEHMGLRLGDAAVARIAAKVNVRTVKKETDALAVDADPITQYRRRHISEKLGAPDGSIDDLPLALRQLFSERAANALRSSGLQGDSTAAPSRNGLSRMVPDRPVIFQHLKKTGGTTIIAMLNNFIPTKPVTPLFRDMSLAAAEREAVSLPFIHHHMPLLHLRSPQSFCFTLLRDPFARLLSDRRQWTQAQDHDIRTMKDNDDHDTATATLRLRGLSLADILDRVFEFPVTAYSFWNHQTFVLGGAPLVREAISRTNERNYTISRFHNHFPDGASYCAWLERNRYAILKKARETLRALDYVGIYEDFENSTREIFARLGLPEPETIPHLNAREHYPDETQEGLKERARPFIDLDEELYDEARELHARHGRAVRGAPMDYVGRLVRADEDRTFTAEEPPGGHGWHESACRADGKWSRWTGPDRKSAFSLRLEQAVYRFELSMFGAVSEAAIRTLVLSMDDAQLQAVVTSLANDRWLASAEFRCDRAGPHEICLAVPAAANGHGIEVEAFRFIGRSINPARRS